METNQHELGYPIRYRRLNMKDGVCPEFPRTYMNIALIVDVSVPQDIFTDWLQRTIQSGAVIERFMASDSSVGSHDAQNRFRANVPYELRMHVVGNSPLVYTLRADHLYRFDTVVTLSYQIETECLFIASCGKDPYTLEYADDDDDDADDDANGWDTRPPSGTHRRP